MLVGPVSLPTLHWPVTKSSKQRDDAVGEMNTQTHTRDTTEHAGATALMNVKVKTSSL